MGALDVLLLVSLLAVTLIVNNFLQKRNLPIPEAICTISIGMLFGGIAIATPQLDRDDFRKFENGMARTFMVVFIAPIIFAEGYGLKSRQFFANIGRILTHAFLGTFISTVIVACMVFFLPVRTGLDAANALTMPESLAFGSLISATDPVTTLAIFKDIGMVENGLGYLYHTVLGESILNDAVAITLYTSFSELVKNGEPLTVDTGVQILIQFILTFAGSMLIGVACGCFTAFVLKVARLGAGEREENHFHFNVHEIGAMLVLSYVPFLIAATFDLSGIVAIMFAGITMRHYAHYNLTAVTRLVFFPVVELVASLCEAYVFLLLGIGVFLMGDGGNSMSLILWAMMGCVIGRAVNVYPISNALNCCSKVKVNMREQHVVWFAGLRGAVAFMCALDFPEGPHSNKRPIVLFTTMIITGVSILVLGWPTGFVLRRLGVTECSPENARVAAERSSECEATCLQRFGSRVNDGLRKALMTEQAVEERNAACESVAHGESGLLSHHRLTLGHFVSCSPEVLVSALGGIRASQYNSKVDDAQGTLQVSITDSKIDAGRTPHASLTASSGSVAAVIRPHTLPTVAARLSPIESGRAWGASRQSDPSGSPRCLTGSQPAASRSTRTMCDP